MEHKYVGQSWVSDLREKSGLDPVAMLQLIVKDLKDTVSGRVSRDPLSYGRILRVMSRASL
jgi:hypothetical protein